MNECSYCGEKTEPGNDLCPPCTVARKCVDCGDPTGDEAAERCYSHEAMARDALEMRQSRLEAFAEDAAEARQEMFR